MAQLQPRRKLVENISQHQVLIPSASVAQDQIVSEQQSFAMVQKTLRTSVRYSDFEKSFASRLTELASR